MIYDARAASEIIGCLLKDNSLLTKTDDYIIHPSDFQDRLHKIIFNSIFNLYYNGASGINALTIEEYLSGYPDLYAHYKKEKGTDFLLTALDIAELNNFDYYYNKFKKYSLLNSLYANGFDISEWYSTDLLNFALRQETYDRLEKASIQDIIQSIQKKISSVQADFLNKSDNVVSLASDGLKDLKERLKAQPEFGMNIEGDILNTITRGGRRTKYYIYSATTGGTKTRTSVGIACKLAYPYYYSEEKKTWVANGDIKKSLFISTELTTDEVQTLILAYLSGVNEEIILNGTYKGDEEKRVDEAISIAELYKDNFHIFHLPDPSVKQLENNIRKLVLENQIDCVFYDYIHTSPALLAEFMGAKIREDVALLLISSALKALANELNIFMWSCTQLNGTEEEGKFATQAQIRGSR